MQENEQKEELLNFGAPLPVSGADVSAFNEIKDNDALLKFCREKNKAKNEELNEDQKKALVTEIKKNILSQNKNLSVETVFELSILLSGNGKVGDLKLYYGIDISELDSFKFDSLNPVFDFIKEHKKQNNNADNIGNYINLIYYFIRFKPVKTYSVKDFLEVMQFDFSNQDTYKNLTLDEFYCIYDILFERLENDKDNHECIAKLIEDTFSYAPCDILVGNYHIWLLRRCKEKCVNISIEVDEKRIAELYKKFCPTKLDFYNWCMLISCCKDHSISQDIFNSMIKDVENQKDFISTVCLNGCKSKMAKTKFSKYIFTPSLISFIKQKFNFDENYDLEKVLNDTFGKNNLVKGDDCDLVVILYRLRFESYFLIPHKKEDIIKLFESTKFLLPEQCRPLYDFNGYNSVDHCIKQKFDCDFMCLHERRHDVKIYEEMDKFVRQIFIEKGVLPKDKDDNNKIILENQANNNYNSKLTLEELKIMACSKFKIGDYDISKQKFKTLIPDNIDNQYYFRWLLEFYRCTNYQEERRTGAPDEISKEDFIFCVKRYKFTSPKDFNDFCYCIGKSRAYNKIKFDVDCVNALLDAYNTCKHVGRIMLTNNEGEILGFNEDHITDYMKDVIKNVQSQFLVNRIKQRFGIKLEIDNKAKQNCVTNQNQLLVDKIEQKFSNAVNSGRVTDLLALRNKDRQRFGKYHKNDKNKTPLWLVIITLGGIFWAPWLFKKIFGCCFDFGGGDISADKNKNLGSSQDLIPDQSSSLEENLGK